MNFVVELSNLDTKILKLLAQGHDFTGVAHFLSISEKDVERHMDNMYSLLEVSTFSHLLRRAKLHGFIPNNML